MNKNNIIIIVAIVLAALLGAVSWCAERKAKTTQPAEAPLQHVTTMPGHDWR